MRALLLALGILFFAGSAEALEAKWDPKKTHVLLVGILEWQDKSLATFPKEKRQDRVLEAQLKKAGVPASQIVFLEDKQATLAAMRRELTALAKRSGPGGTLMFYFTGHGLKDGHDVFLANYDVGKPVRSTGFAVTDITRILTTHWKGDRLLLFGDNCHSGGLSKVVTDLGKRGVKAASLTSSTANNLSTGNWTFTEALVRVFQGHGLIDRDRDGRVTFQEADTYLHREMRYAEDQLTWGVRSPGFEPAFAFSRTDPKLVPVEAPTGKQRWVVGDYVEALDLEKKWYRAQVIAIQGDKYRVHFAGWGAEWDEWVDMGRTRPVPGSDWKVGDRVTVEWNDGWYPARILKAFDDYFFFIHYDDDGEEWDEWVSPSRIRPAQNPG